MASTKEQNFQKRTLWIGRLPPLCHFEQTTILLDDNKNFRCPSDMHGKFDEVYFVELNLASYKAWPIIIDELFRLLKREGELILRYGETHFLNHFNLKMLIANKTNNRAVVTSEKNWPDSQTVTRFSIKQDKCSPKECWSFGVIYDGSKVEHLIRLVESIQNAKGSNVRQIIVCGPFNELLSNKGVIFIDDTPSPSDSGWISRKKNLIVQQATHENLCILHNRYLLSDDFFVGFTNFGYDFDVLTCKQIKPDSTRFPDWVTTGDFWQITQQGLLDYRDFNYNLYINGGLIIAKKSVLQKFPWNELLFWNQAEDVELSRRLYFHGIVPRINTYSEIIAIDSRHGYTEGFITLPYSPSQYLYPYNHHFAANIMRKSNTGGLFAYQYMPLRLNDQIRHITKTYLKKILRKLYVLAPPIVRAQIKILIQFIPRKMSERIRMILMN